ncbi:response regulator [Deinococcus ruber]|uniref:Response regulator n=1 Tax=Deinococcus ruber TaxID=1848197 RepID=A0A918C527_9DEIO|nr:response regulator [Deinococcus ruber]GGR06244.1 response regulator [Deinococcus ruber]
MPTFPIQLLLVEDSEPDIILIQEALDDIAIEVHLHVARDGIEALAYLRRQPPFEQALLPDMILMDINMPRKNGLAVLHEIKTDLRLMQIPVVMLTTSQAKEDIALAYEWQASSYIVKPVGYSAFMQAIQALEDYWGKAVRFPPRE